MKAKDAKVRLDELFQRWARWMDKQGFYVMVGLCLAVIAGSALWTRQTIADPPPETLAVGEAGEFQQRLADVINPATPEPTAAPTPTPEPRWVRPVSGDTLRVYSHTELVYQPTMDAWAIHSAVDLAAATGEPVLSPVDGKVYAVASDARYGLTVAVKLADSSILSLTGLKSASVSMGDNVTAGQSIGAAGGSLAAEASDPVHIHINWEKNGKTLDPSLMWD